MIRKILLISSLFLIFISSFANESSLNAFHKANQAYDSAFYTKAIGIYEGLLQEHIVSSDLHYNLGNAYFKQNQIPLAILNYEKALKIEPNHGDAAYNLKLANEKTIDKIEGIPELFLYRWWKTIFNLFSAETWAKITLCLIYLAVVFSVFYFFSRTVFVKKLGFYIATTLFILSLGSWFLAHQQQAYLNQMAYAIILEPTVNINSSPSAGSSKLFVLHEGTKVKIEDQTDTWFEVSIPNGNKGWIKAELIQGI
ncbi:MAG: tetratricopeptide repeat protein [Bacteroidetes bacterium]|nr:MAG: tetratricopeptide repeat protein [Bacteroidota bacterium]MBL1145293.1 tetratricopeptide repeat protein [Bacteroidota bacterium]NOG58090.1 tetratricopeptide repeat protein [Bacteroidota bacterium]